MEFIKTQQTRYSLRDERGTVGLSADEQARLAAVYKALTPKETK